MPSKRTQIIRSEACRLREQGLSLANIAFRFGVSKQYVAKLLKSPESSTTGSAGESTETVNQLTVRQRRFAKGLIEGKTQKQAALDAVEPGQLTEGSAEQYASRQLNNPRFRKAFQEILLTNGLADEDIARVHRENLEATKVVGWEVDEDGRRRPLMHPDYAVRQRAVVDAWKIKGRVRSEPLPEPQEKPKILILTQEQLAMFKRIREDPFPKEHFTHLHVSSEVIREVAEDMRRISSGEDVEDEAEADFDGN